MLIVKFILGLIPIIWLIIALTGLKMPGYKACIITVIITAIESIAIWHFNPVYMLTAALEARPRTHHRLGIWLLYGRYGRIRNSCRDPGFYPCRIEL